MKNVSFLFKSIDQLGYRISNGIIKPDPERMRVLIELPVPHNCKSLEPVVGMFAYYAKWIKQFSDKIKPLKSAQTFPLSSDAVSAFDMLKNDLATVGLTAIDKNMPFVVETDALRQLSLSSTQPRWTTSCFSFKVIAGQ